MRVISNTAVSVDGKIALASGARARFGSVTDRRYMSVLRARADAVLVGGQTFRTWTVPLVPDPNALASLRASGFEDTVHPSIEGRRWWNVVVTRTLAVPMEGAFYRDDRVRPLFFTPSDAPAPGEVERGPVDVPHLLSRLEARGVETLLIEGGGGILGAFLAADAVDEVYLTVCPLVVGGGAPTVSGEHAMSMRRLSLVYARPVQDEIFCRWRRCT